MQLQGRSWVQPAGVPPWHVRGCAHLQRAEVQRGAVHLAPAWSEHAPVLLRRLSCQELLRERLRGQAERRRC